MARTTIAPSADQKERWTEAEAFALQYAILVHMGHLAPDPDPDIEHWTSVRMTEVLAARLRRAQPSRLRRNSSFRSHRGVTQRFSTVKRTYIERLDLQERRDLPPLRLDRQAHNPLLRRFLIEPERTAAVARTMWREWREASLLVENGADNEQLAFEPRMDAVVAHVSAREGRGQWKLHFDRERRESLRWAKIAQASARPVCEACSFDFEAIYGRAGRGYIEVHHTVPLSAVTPLGARGDGVVNDLDDLVLLCANCHRVVHRKRKCMPVDRLKSILERSKKRSRSS